MTLMMMKMMILMIKNLKWPTRGQFWSYNIKILHGDRSKWYLQDDDNDDNDDDDDDNDDNNDDDDKDDENSKWP